MVLLRRNASRVHSYFFPAQEKHGSYRFCKKCWADKVLPESLEGCAEPGRTYFPGCVKITSGCSPGNLKSHLEQCVGLKFGKAAKSKQEEPAAYNEELTDEYVHDMVLGDLRPFSLFDGEGGKSFRNRRLRGLGDRRQVRASVLKWARKGKEDMRTRVRNLRLKKRRPTIGIDVWTSKGSHKRKFVALMGWWMEDWKQNMGCLAVKELRGRKTAAMYKATIKDLISAYGDDLLPESTIGFISDHEGALRKATHELGYTTIGCGCHGIQLQPRAILPPAREPKRKQEEAILDEDVGDIAEDEGDIDEDEGDDVSLPSLDSESDSEPEGDIEDAGAEMQEVSAGEAVVSSGEIQGASAGEEKAAPKGSKRRCFDPEECEALRAELVPVFRKARILVKWHINHPDDYNALIEESESMGIPVKRFVRETSTRWCSQDGQLASVLYNTPALRKKCERGTYRGPALFDEVECKLVAELCGVLTPHRVATRILDRDGHNGSGACFLPTWLGLESEVGKDQIPRPDHCGPYGYQEGGATFFEYESVGPIPKRVQKWLRGDTRRTYEKFTGGTACEKVLRKCAFFDPRFKKLHFLNPADIDEVRKDIKKEAVSLAKESPDWSVVVARSEAIAAAKALPVAIEEYSVAALGVLNKKDLSGMKVPELREQCRKRFLDEKGLRASLVDRLLAYSPKKAEEAAISASAAQEAAASNAAICQGKYGESNIWGVSAPSVEEVDVDTAKFAQRIKDQVKDYVEEPTLARDCCPLSWWRENAPRFPTLAILAEQYLGVPGSSSALERLFSGFGHVVNPQRNKIESGIACDVVFCHENIKHGFL